MKAEMNSLIAENRKVRHDFSILDAFESGIELKGTEVKSCRKKNVSFKDAYAKVENGQIFLYNMHISPYECGNRFNHDPLRRRKLLLKKCEIRKMHQQIKERGLTIIPLKLYFKNGKVKAEIALAKGKTHGDKRETLKKKQHELETRKAISSFK